MHDLECITLIRRLLADARAALDSAAGDLTLVSALGQDSLGRDAAVLAAAVEREIDALVTSGRRWAQLGGDPEALP